MVSTLLVSAKAAYPAQRIAAALVRSAVRTVPHDGLRRFEATAHAIIQPPLPGIA
jgi:hypothetical protein